MDELQHISGLGDMRQVDLGLDSVFRASRPGGLRCRLPFRGGRLEVRAYFFRFVVLERAGMSFLFRDAHNRQHVEYGFALNFQFPCQIVDSNLTHPPSCSSDRFRYAFIVNLTGSVLSYVSFCSAGASSPASPSAAASSTSEEGSSPAASTCSAWFSSTAPVSF